MQPRCLYSDFRLRQSLCCLQFSSLFLVSFLEQGYYTYCTILITVWHISFGTGMIINVVWSLYHFSSTQMLFTCWNIKPLNWSYWTKCNGVSFTRGLPRSGWKQLREQNSSERIKLPSMTSSFKTFVSARQVIQMLWTVILFPSSTARWADSKERTGKRYSEAYFNSSVYVALN